MVIRLTLVGHGSHFTLVLPGLDLDERFMAIQINYVLHELCINFHVFVFLGGLKITIIHFFRT